MAQVTKELQALWWGYLGAAERLLRSLHEQTAALTLRDVERVERIQPELDSLLDQMRRLDEDAVCLARGLADKLGAEPSLRSLLAVLEPNEAKDLQALANRVTVAARNVQQVLDKNRKLLESELAYVNGSMALLAKVASEQPGRFGTSPQAAVLMDRVA